MSKHTPAPWVAVGTDIAEQADYIHLYGADGDEIGAINGPQESERVQANAALIAAAPDLLAALKAARPVVNAIISAFGSVWVDTDGKQQDFGARLKAIDAAIAKAEGKQ